MKKKLTRSAGSAEKILDAAAREFARYGLAGSRVDRIAKLARVNKAMIYYHYRSKENLYQIVIRRHLGKIGDFLESSLSKENDAEAFLNSLADFYDQMFTERNDFAPIFLRELAAGGERIRHAFAEMMSKRQFVGKLMQLLETGKKRGEIRGLNNMHAIVSFIGMNLFYLIAAPVIHSVWEIKDEKKFRQERKKEVVDLFLYGLKSR